MTAQTAASQRARVAAVLIGCSVVVQIALTTSVGGVPTRPAWLLAHSLLLALVFLGLPVAAAALLLRRRVDLGTALLIPTAVMSAYSLLFATAGVDAVSHDIVAFLLQTAADLLLVAAAVVAWTARTREHWTPARSWPVPYLVVALAAVTLGHTGGQLWWMITTRGWPVSALVAIGVSVLLVAALLAVAGILRRPLGGAILLATIAPAVLGSLAQILSHRNPQLGGGPPVGWTTFLGLAAELALLGIAVWWLTSASGQSPAAKNRHSPTAEMPIRESR